jgi:hypothetical protein
VVEVLEITLDVDKVFYFLRPKSSIKPLVSPSMIGTS